MRVLVTGGGGQLGRELTPVLKRLGHQAVAAGREECDVTNQHLIDLALSRLRPDVVINCASWTRVDAAESEPEVAERVNALGPRLLAEACGRASVFLCHLSTDFVFDGTATEPIDESAVPSPLSVYGHTKLEGENEVRRFAPRHQIVRTSWLYGEDGPNFVLTILRLARERDRLRVVADQHGTPTWTGHLAPAVVRLVERGTTGTFHITNSGETTWHGFAEAIVDLAGLAVPVDPITTAEYPLPARRPAYSVLDNRAWRQLGEPPLPDWREGLAAYIGELQERGQL
jgi:dTDP-4-dehydrorhamnose reductase